MAHSTRSGSMRSEREYEPIAIEFEQLHRPRSSSFAQSRGQTDDSNIDHETKPILDIHIDTGFDIPLITQVQHFETANGTSGRASPACTEDTEEALIERGRVPIRQASEEESSKVSAASRKRKSLRKGWRAGIVAAGVLTMLVLLLNSILTIWASLKFDLKDGIGDLIMHDCSAIDSWSIALHALINAFGTAILSASNYAMQCLTAPTRKECDIAHARGDWLDIGVPSVRNVSRIQWSRRIVWALLALSGIPLHLLYNSAVFKELDDTRHNKAVLVSHQFLETEDIDFSIFKDVLATLSERAPNGTQEEIDGALYAELKLQWYIEPLVSHLHAAYRAEPSVFDRLNPRECIDLYAGPTLTGHSHLFAVVNAGTNLSDFTSPSPINDYSSKTLPDWTDLYLTEAEAEAIPSFWSLEYGVYHLRASGEVDPFLDGPPMPDYEYCLAKVMESQCKLQFSLPIMVTVIICMMIKSILMVWILWYHREETFVTFGDAIASWLDKPDASTKGDCLMRKTDAGPKKLEARVHGPGHSQLIARHGSGVRRCGVTIGIKRWLSTIAVYVVATAATAVALWQLSRITMFGQTILNGGFGTVNPNMKISTRMPTSGGLVAMVIIANSPHLLASLWYLLYNGLFTCMHLSLEYSGYAKERKSLRVTTPRGDQRSTYWLQLPYTYALPLMAAFAVLHWLVSQSVFLVRLVPVKDELVMGGSYSPPDPELVRSHLGFTTVNVPGHRKSADDDTSSDLGFSVAPIVAVMAVSFCMLLAVIAMGFRKLESSMPIAGSCSFALAAATHRPKADVDASVLPVMWGEVPDMGSEDVGHCCFTSQEVVETVPERKYAGVSQDESVYMAGRGADRRENCMYSRE